MKDLKSRAVAILNSIVVNNDYAKSLEMLEHNLLCVYVHGAEDTNGKLSLISEERKIVLNDDGMLECDACERIMPKEEMNWHDSCGWVCPHCVR